MALSKLPSSSSPGIRLFKPDTIARFSPTSSALSAAFISKLCSVCLKALNGTKLIACKKCKFVRYCSSRCEHENYDVHKHECKLLRGGGKFDKWAALSEVATDKVLLIFRLLRKVASGELETEKAPIDDISLEELAKRKQLKDAVELLVGKPIDDALFTGVYAKAKIATALTSSLLSTTPIGLSVNLRLSAFAHSCRPNVQTIVRRRGAMVVVPLLDADGRALVDANDAGVVRICSIDMMATKGVRRSTLQRVCECERCADPRDALLSAIRCCHCGHEVPVDDSSFRRFFGSHFRRMSAATRQRLGEIAPELAVILCAPQKDEQRYYGDEWRKMELVCDNCEAHQPIEWVEYALALMSAVGLLAESDSRPRMNDRLLYTMDRECEQTLPDCNLFAGFWHRFFASLPAKSSKQKKVDRADRLLKWYTLVEVCIPFGHEHRFIDGVATCEALLDGGKFEEAERILGQLETATDVYYRIGVGEASPFADRLRALRDRLTREPQPLREPELRVEFNLYDGTMNFYST